ncbi:ArsR/SmtB family transcription factor [Nanoarchaeota archaeon]
MKDFKEKSEYFKSLSEPIRLRIIEHLLYKKECLCICELSKLLNKDQSVIFRHIQILKKVGIVETCKENKYLMCCIKNKRKVKKLLED